MFLLNNKLIRVLECKRLIRFLFILHKNEKVYAISPFSHFLYMDKNKHLLKINSFRAAAGVLIGQCGRSHVQHYLNANFSNQCTIVFYNY